MIEQIYEIFIKSTGVSIDTRTIKKNNLFFALKGQNFDGNNFIYKALEKGAIAAISDNPKFKKNNKVILVENTLKTLQQLANYHRKKLNFKVLAITGTNGKTTTKELIGRVLEQKFNTYYTKGNLNNHIGVPLNLLNIKQNCQIAVIEMGASLPNDIELLCSIAHPNYGLITNIGKAHIQGFGDFQTLLNTKTQLYDFLKKNNGTIFYNSDNQILKKHIGNYSKIYTYGIKTGKITGNIDRLTPFLTVKATLPNNKSLRINTKLIGHYNLENVLAAVSVGVFFDIEPSVIKYAIENYIPQNNRSQLEKTDKNLLIRDLYNANPISMLSALENLKKIKHKQKAVIIGDMLELGEIAKNEHQKIVEWLKNTNFKVFLVGEIFTQINNHKEFKTFRTTEQLKEYLKQNPLEGYLILLKASRGIHLEKLLQIL